MARVMLLTGKFFAPTLEQGSHQIVYGVIGVRTQRGGGHGAVRLCGGGCKITSR